MSNWFCPKCGHQVTGRNGTWQPGDKPLLCLVCERAKEEHTAEQIAACSKGKCGC